jgi:predicted amidohydrolase
MPAQGPVLAVAQSASRRGDILGNVGRHARFVEAAARAGATVYAAGVLITPTGIEADSAQLRGYVRTHGMAVLMSNYAAPTGGFASASRSAVWDERGEIVIEAPGEGEPCSSPTGTGTPYKVS